MILLQLELTETGRRTLIYANEIFTLGESSLSVREQLYVITTQRRRTHPAVIAICQVAREEVFGRTA